MPTKMTALFMKCKTGTVDFPGAILTKKFLQPNGITQLALAKRIGASARRINEICRGRRAITPATALLLGKAFSNSPMYWMGLQTDWDLQKASERMGSIRIRKFKKGR